LTPQQEGQEHDRVSRGKQAENILRNPLFVEAIAAIQGDIWSDFKNTDPSDRDGLQRVRLREDVLVHFTGIFTSHVQTGELAAKNLTRWEKLRRRLTK
jgi:hypothetical protein